MREFRFRFLLSNIDILEILDYAGYVRTTDYSGDYITIKVWHTDYFVAREIAEKEWRVWLNKQKLRSHRRS